MDLWNFWTLAMIWSLISHVEQPLNKFAQKNLSPIWHKILLEKGPIILYGKDTMTLLQWKIMCWYMFAQYLQENVN